MTVYDLYNLAFALFTEHYYLPSVPPLHIRPGEGEGLIAEVKDSTVHLYETDLPTELIVHIFLHELGHIRSAEWEPKAEGDISPCLRIGYMIWSEWIAERLARNVDGLELVWPEEELTPELVYRHLEDMPGLEETLEEIGEGPVGTEALEEIGSVYLREVCSISVW